MAGKPSVFQVDLGHPSQLTTIGNYHRPLNPKLRGPRQYKHLCEHSVGGRGRKSVFVNCLVSPAHAL